MSRRAIGGLTPSLLIALALGSCVLPELEKISDGDASSAGSAGKGGGGSGGSAGVGAKAGSGGGSAASGGANGGVGGSAATDASAGSGGTAGASAAGGAQGIGGTLGAAGSLGAGPGGAAGAGGSSGKAGTAGAGGSSGKAGTAGAAGCTPGTTACTDCIDNDGDGNVDGRDDDCTGVIDNDEGSFATGIPGDNTDPCVKDCYYDGNSGAGDDLCRWKLQCDQLGPGAPACPYDPVQVGTSGCPNPQTPQCLSNCLPATPNGCDCFGCCQIPGASSSAVLIAKVGCSTTTLTDPMTCPACTIRPDCFNPCDNCELCLGKHVLGGACGGLQQCPMAHARCGLSGQAPCPAGSFCLTGCCT